MSNKYTSARFIAALTQILGWAILLLGIAGAFAMQRELRLPGVILSVAVSTVSALVLLAAAQITLAVLDTAESTATTAENTRHALDRLDRIATATADTATGTQPVAPKPAPGNPVPITPPVRAASANTAGTEVIPYRNYRIFRDLQGNISCNGQYFDTVHEARRWVDQQIKG